MACWRVGLSGAVWDGRSLLSWSCGGEDLRWRRDFAAVGDGGHEQRVRAAQSACGQRWAEQSGGAGARGWCTPAAHGNGSVERRGVAWSGGGDGGWRRGVGKLRRKKGRRRGVKRYMTSGPCKIL